MTIHSYIRPSPLRWLALANTFHVFFLLNLILLFSTTVLVHAQGKFYGDRKAVGDEFDSFKTETTVAGMEKTNRIKRSKISVIKPQPVKAYMLAIEEDGRLEKFYEILKEVNKVEADSCTGCWSVFNKLSTGAKIALASANSSRKKKAPKPEVKNDDPVDPSGKAEEAIVKKRDPNLTVIETSRSLFLEMAVSKESQEIHDSLLVLSEHLLSNTNKTRAEQDYFSTLSHYMLKPYSDLEDSTDKRDLE